MTETQALFDLRDKVAVVTGASSGLGTQMARALSGAGAQVVVSARRQSRLDELASSLGGAGGGVISYACDVVDESQVDGLVNAVTREFGRVDVLVNNAGMTEVVPAELESSETFTRVMQTNLFGAFHCAQRFGRVMLEAGQGSIVNIASVLGLVGSGQIPQASYAASKGAVVNLTRELAAQWARRGVRVNAIAPGWFESEMTAEMFGDESSERWMKSRTPMGRSGKPGELDGALVFLASGASEFVTGQVIAVDGGWTIV